MPINHKTSQHEVPWGKNAFESYAMKYSPDPQPMENCGCLQIDGTNASIISIGQDAPLITYEGDPVLLMSLSNCECFVNYQQGSNLIVIMPEVRRPMQSVLQGLNPEAYQELLFQLSVLYDIEDCQANDVLNKRNAAVWSLLLSFKDAVRAGTIKADQILQQYTALSNSGDSLFFFEEQLVRYLEKIKTLDQETAMKLLENAPLFMIMERFGNAPGQVILLDKHSPVILGKGDYIVFEPFTQTEQLVGRESNFLKFCSALFATPCAFQFDFETSKVAAEVQRQATFIKSQQNEVTMEKNIIHVKINGSHPFQIQFHYNHNQDVEIGGGEQHTTFCQLIGTLEVEGTKQIVPAFVTLQPGEKAVCQLRASFQEGELGLLVLQYQ